MWAFWLIVMGLSGHAESGFQPAGEISLPPAVRAAESSILKIYFPYYMILKRTEAHGLLTATNLTDAGRREIADCVASNLELCAIPIIQVEGTAFRDRRNENALWTNCHLVDPWLR